MPVRQMRVERHASKKRPALPQMRPLASKAGNAVTAPKTGAERVEAHNARLRDQGLKQIRSLWAYPEDHKAIRAYVSRLTGKRLLRMVGKA